MAVAPDLVVSSRGTSGMGVAPCSSTGSGACFRGPVGNVLAALASLLLQDVEELVPLASEVGTSLLGVAAGRAFLDLVIGDAGLPDCGCRFHDSTSVEYTCLAGSVSDIRKMAILESCEHREERLCALQAEYPGFLASECVLRRWKREGLS